MNDREAVLAAIGISARKERLPAGSQRRVGAILDAEEMWKAFEQNLVGLGGKMASLSQIAPRLQSPVWIDEDCSYHFPSVVSLEDIWAAEVGVTLADFAVAESGSLVISARPGRRRLASLTPPVHVALVSEIVGTLEEALDRLSGRTTVIVTGTSRTADIEGVLVRGVHGPRELIVVRMEQLDPLSF